jgi:hypothetical protein
MTPPRLNPRVGYDHLVYTGDKSLLPPRTPTRASYMPDVYDPVRGLMVVCVPERYPDPEQWLRVVADLRASRMPEKGESRIVPLSEPDPVRDACAAIDRERARR